VFQRCGGCDVARHPPAPRCGHCGSTATTWQRASGPVTVYSYTVVHHPMHPSAVEAVPYVVVLLEFADVPGVRLATDLVGPRRLDVGIGDEVRIVWARLDDTCALPLAEHPPTPAPTTSAPVPAQEIT
jgi:uncharacterized protein